MADQTMLNLPVAASVDGSEYAWIVQGGTDKRCTLEDIANTAPGLLPVGGLNGQVLIKQSDDNYDTRWATVTGIGTVTSVGLALPAIFSVSGSPVTAAGTLTATLATQVANLVWSGPTTGADAAPTFRALVIADLPIVTLAKGGTNANLTASNGGIFYSTASAGAILTGTATANQILLSGSSAAPSWSTATYPVTAAAGRMLAAGSANVISATATPTLGIAGSVLGTIALAGNTSGTVTITPQAAAGTPTITLPNASGTIAVSATAPLVLSATTGALSITAAALTKVDDTNVTLTLGGTPAAALIAATSLTLGWTGQLGLTRGGTAASLTASNGGVVYSTASALAILNGTATANLPMLSGASGAPSWAAVSHPTSATSGGVPYFSSTSVMATSGLLTANGVVLGGGAGSAPTSTTVGTNGQVLMGNTGSAPTFQGMSTSITFIIDGGGATITTGVKGDLTIPFGCTITEWTLLGDQSGSIVVDVWKDVYGSYPPTVADTITGSAKPTISTATKGQSSTLTGWTITIAAGDTLRFNVDSITALQRCTLSLKVTRTSA